LWGAIHGDDIDFAANQLGRKLGGALVSPLRPAILDREVATLDPPEFTQSLQESGRPWALCRSVVRAKQTHGRDFSGLLRACRQRPCCGRAAERG
jgi:hypothetical protein